MTFCSNIRPNLELLSVHLYTFDEEITMSFSVSSKTLAAMCVLLTVSSVALAETVLIEVDQVTDLGFTKRANSLSDLVQ